MSGADSTLSNAKPLIDSAKRKADTVAPKVALKEEIGVDGVEALKLGFSSLGSAIATPFRRIRGEGFHGYSADEKKEWWKEKKSFKIGLIKTSGLDKVISIYGETFDLSKRLSKEERKVFDTSCSYKDVDDDKEELTDTNYEKAKVYGMNLKNNKGNPDKPEIVETTCSFNYTSFTKPKTLMREIS